MDELRRLSAMLADAGIAHVSNLFGVCWKDADGVVHVADASVDGRIVVSGLTASQVMLAMSVRMTEGTGL